MGEAGWCCEAILGVKRHERHLKKKSLFTLCLMYLGCVTSIFLILCCLVSFSLSDLDSDNMEYGKTNKRLYYDTLD